MANNRQIVGKIILKRFIKIVVSNRGTIAVTQGVVKCKSKHKTEWQMSHLLVSVVQA